MILFKFILHGISDHCSESNENCPPEYNASHLSSLLFSCAIFVNTCISSNSFNVVITLFIYDINVLSIFFGNSNIFIFPLKLFILFLIFAENIIKLL